MSSEQVQIQLLHHQFKLGVKSEEKAALLRGGALLQQKAQAIRDNSQIIDSEKIIAMAALSVIGDLLKTPIDGQEGLAIGEIERRIGDMVNACEKALSKNA
ncbi:MAG: cell division protein ZapA [Neisseria sp.]|nr:cell division protein ZapA [Neisseria sp.]